MQAPPLFLLVLNFSVVGALPRFFFRADGRFNVRWWLTATPFGLCPLFLLAAVALDWQPLVPDTWRTTLGLASTALSAASLALIFLTLGTHRVPVSLWHQENDTPQHLVTHGAYRWIRHPFYTAFSLAFLAGTVLFPHAVTFAVSGYGIAALTVTAAREERRLGASEFGEEYRTYARDTGRFLPRVVRG